MARYIIDHELTEAEAIKEFSLDGYGFDSDLSQGKDWVFSRRQ